MRLAESLLCALTAPLGGLAGCVDDKCLRAVAKRPNAHRNATADCEAYLRFTTTATAVQTVTASTETLIQDQTTTVAETLTVVETVTATQTVPPVSGSVVFVRAADKESDKSQIPPYARGQCRSFEQYQSACSRIGVLPTTITVTGATVQTSVTATTVVTSVVTVPTTNATVSLTTTATATVAATPETSNIVPNGGFESGTLAGWTVADNTTGEVLSPGSNSSFYLRLGPIDDGGVRESPFLLHQVWTTVPATKGANYTCSFEWAFERYLVPQPQAYLPACRAWVNGVLVASPFMLASTNYERKWSTRMAQFNYTSQGEDLLEFAAYSVQNKTQGENYFWLDNVVCVPADSA